jgi:hypothetical protein
VYVKGGVTTRIDGSGRDAQQVRWGSPQAELAVKQLVDGGFFDDRKQAAMQIAQAAGGSGVASVVGNGFQVEFTGIDLGRVATGRDGPTNQVVVEAVFGASEDGEATLGGFVAARVLGMTPLDVTADIGASAVS